MPLPLISHSKTLEFAFVDESLCRGREVKIVWSTPDVQDCPHKCLGGESMR